MQLVDCMQDQNNGDFVFDYYAVAVGETDADGDIANVPIVQVDCLLDGDNLSSSRTFGFNTQTLEQADIESSLQDMQNVCRCARDGTCCMVHSMHLMVYAVHACWGTLLICGCESRHGSVL